MVSIHKRLLSAFPDRNEREWMIWSSKVYLIAAYVTMEGTHLGPFVGVGEAGAKSRAADLTVVFPISGSRAKHKELNHARTTKTQAAPSDLLP